jgi:hypothetical protein|tara:strand:+ start:7813 stop:8742 length:930 start_codon:yes stop_codon:yes gene_type:complete
MAGLPTHVNQKLEDRSRLLFVFPQAAGKDPIIRICPFFENPTITERRNSNLVKYDVLGRSGNVFGYTGSKSRKLDVEFNITLPQVLHFASQNFSTEKITQETDDSKRDQFFEDLDTQTDAAIIATKWQKKRQEFLKVLNNGVDPFIPGDPDPAPLPDDTSDLQFAAQMNNGYAASHLYAQAVEIIMFWIGLIRSSTMNNSQNPTLGPPIIKLRHGLLFDRISTIADNYSIDIVEAAGYDNASLLPRRIKVKLSLFEIQKNPNNVPGDPEETIYGWERNVDNKYLKRLTQGDGADLDFAGGGVWSNSYGK